MAYPVSVSFSISLCAPNTSFKQMYWEKDALAGLSKKATARTGTNHLAAPCRSNRGLFSGNLSCHRHLTASSKHLDGPCLDFAAVLHLLAMTAAAHMDNP